MPGAPGCPTARTAPAPARERRATRPGVGRVGGHAEERQCSRPPGGDPVPHPAPYLEQGDGEGGGLGGGWDSHREAGGWGALMEGADSALCYVSFFLKKDYPVKPTPNPKSQPKSQTGA